MRGWIPPLPLLFGALAFGGSWGVLFAYAMTGNLGITFLGLGWVHTVALAWITTIALAILIHALPGFTDVEWDAWPARIARACSVIFALAAFALVVGFVIEAPMVLEVAGTTAFAALAAYAVCALQPVGRALRGARVERAVARAFAGVLIALLATGLLGMLFAFALAGRVSASTLFGVPQAHALLGIGGWLTLLVVGVSARTMRPICGVRSRNPRLHILFSSALSVGTVVAATGAWLRLEALLLAGCVLLTAGAIAYACDLADILARAVVPHRTPQLFMAAAAAWMVITALLLDATALGYALVQAVVYAALIGWIGSAVLAHMHHIGIRVLLTRLHGEEDETRPQEVLLTPLSFATLGIYQAAALIGAVAFIVDSAPALVFAAVLGFLSFACLVANVARAAIFVVQMVG